MWEGMESIHTVSATLQCYFLNESFSIITLLNRDRKSSKSHFISHKHFCTFCTSDTKGMSDFYSHEKVQTLSCIQHEYKQIIRHSYIVQFPRETMTATLK